MFQQLIQWIRVLFGKAADYRTQKAIADSAKYKQRYEDICKINFAEIFASSLANKAVTDCNLTVTDSSGRESKRSEVISETLAPVWGGIKQTLTQALGKGGKFLVPYVTGNRIYITGIDQTRGIVNAVNGDGEITSLSVVAEVKEIGTTLFQRMIDYTLENGVIAIRTRIVDKNGAEAELGAVPEWEGITPGITIGNVEKMLVGYLKCPKDSRQEGDFYGVPITYGSEDIIRQLYDCMDEIESEYRLKRAFVGADELLFDKDNQLPEDGLFKRFRSAGALNNGKSFWEVFDPAIRDSSYYNRLNSLCAMLEKSVGTSKGILTEPATFGATATEIKSANHDTFCLVSDIRKNIENCFEDLAYAVDVYAEYFGISPRGASGDFKVMFDWDMSLVESSSETFDQLSELESRGLISGARLNSWVTGQSMEDAQAEIDAVQGQRAKTAAAMLNPEDLEPGAEE